MVAPRLDVYSLIAALNAQREARGISWRKVAQEAEVSPSSLTRMQQGKLPDVNTFAALTHWLNMPGEDFLKSDDDENARPGPHPLALASSLLRGKREMSVDAVKALDELMNAAFKFTNFTKDIPKK